MSTWTPPEERGDERDHPRLLPELIDLVLSFLNPADYTLVSKGWLDPGRKHLFKRIGLHVDYPQKKPVHFAHFLVEAPHISHYIRLLVLLQGTGCKVSVNKLSTLLRYLPRLDTLVLHMLCIKSIPDIRSQGHDLASPFHLKELKLILIWLEQSYTTSSPLYDLFSIFSSIQTLTLQDCESGFGDFHIPLKLNKRVAISRINYSPGEDEDDYEDEDNSDDSDDLGSSDEEDKHDSLKPLSILFRDYIDLPTVKTVGAHIITLSHLAYVVRLIDESFQSADSPLNIEFVFAAISDVSSRPPSAVEDFKNHLPLTHALTSATLILELTGDNMDDGVFLRVISTHVLAQPPPNIRWLSLEVEIETWYPSITQRVDVLKEFDWTAFGRAIKGWRTLEHIQIIIRLGKGNEDEKSIGITQLRKDILHGVGVVGHIVKGVTFI